MGYFDVINILPGHPKELFFQGSHEYQFQLFRDLQN